MFRFYDRYSDESNLVMATRIHAFTKRPNRNRLKLELKREGQPLIFSRVTLPLQSRPIHFPKRKKKKHIHFSFNLVPIDFMVAEIRFVPHTIRKKQYPPNNNR